MRRPMRDVALTAAGLAAMLEVRSPGKLPRGQGRHRMGDLTITPAGLEAMAAFERAAAQAPAQAVAS